jgi:hypothetical protein
MKSVVLFSFLACLLYVTEARIDNKFATEYHKNTQEERGVDHHVPVVNLDVDDSVDDAEEGNVVEPEVKKFMGHMRREGHDRYQGDNIHGNHDKKKHKDHGHSGHDRRGTDHVAMGHRGKDTQVRGHHDKGKDEEHHVKDDKGHGSNTGMQSKKMNRRGKNHENWKKWKVHKHLGSVHMVCITCGIDNNVCTK